MSADAIRPPLAAAPARWYLTLRALDPRVLAPALVLVAIGLISLAADKPVAMLSQARWCVVGLAVMLAAIVVPYRKLLALAYPFYAVSLLCLGALLVPGLGRTANHATRWLQLGPIGFQPSELAKVAVVMVLARYIRFRRDHRTFKGLVVPFLLTLIPLALIVKQPDLGTALMLVPVLFVLLWAAGAQRRHLMTVVVLGVLSLPLVYSVLQPYQQARVRSFVEPAVVLVADLRSGADEASTDAAAAGATNSARAATSRAAAGAPDRHHVTESLAAIAGGGITGQGFREGFQNRTDRVPESWTDFIFSVFAEEWGFLGVLILLLAEGLLLIGLGSVAFEVKEPAGRLLAIGALVILGTQTCVNLAMTVGLAPITGLPLPFLSYGGSSMLTSWLLLGLALNAKAHRPLVFTARDFD